MYPALRAMGCKYIDCIFISHTDNDHISAVMELIKMCDDTFSIGSIVMPDIKGKENIEAYMKLVDMAYKARHKCMLCRKRIYIYSRRAGY